MKDGFSLVELSIVLVILGLLTGGILSGQSLIQAAELRTVSTQMFNYRTAMMTFRDKYMALPGDMTNATKFWGTDAGGCPTNTNWQTGKKETCDGNGDGMVGTGPEMFRVWQQLASAGLIEGSYSGVTGPNTSGSCTGVDHRVGINVPASKISNAGFALETDGGIYVASGAVTYLFEGVYRNVLMFGQNGSACPTIGITLTPEEAWNIDTKLDDGKPGQGKIVPRTKGAAGHVNCTDGDNTQAATAQYRFDYTSPACGLYFRE